MEQCKPLFQIKQYFPAWGFGLSHLEAFFLWGTSLASSQTQALMAPPLSSDIKHIIQELQQGTNYFMLTCSTCIRIPPSIRLICPLESWVGWGGGMVSSTAVLLHQLIHKEKPEWDKEEYFPSKRDQKEYFPIQVPAVTAVCLSTRLLRARVSQQFTQKTWNNNNSFFARAH
jgi:hypothetical protein